MEYPDKELADNFVYDYTPQQALNFIKQEGPKLYYELELGTAEYVGRGVHSFGFFIPQRNVCVKITRNTNEAWAAYRIMHRPQEHFVRIFGVHYVPGCKIWVTVAERLHNVTLRSDDAPRGWDFVEWRLRLERDLKRLGFDWKYDGFTNGPCVRELARQWGLDEHNVPKAFDFGFAVEPQVYVALERIPMTT